MYTTVSFIYSDNKYKLCINPDDSSGNGCIREIITRNNYGLDNFKNITSTIIDIGANCGVATIILAKQNPKSIYIFF